MNNNGTGIAIYEIIMQAGPAWGGLKGVRLGSVWDF